MDVKYVPADWEKMKSGIGNLIGLGVYGKGMIDDLKDISSNFEDAESAVARYDSDGVISFRHTDKKNTYQSLFEDFKVLHRFTGKVGDIVDRTIDQPFYEDIDAFVAEVQELSISNYKTKNRIGVTKIVHLPGSYESMEVPKTEVGLDDLFSGDSFYAEQMKLEYEAWKQLNADQDITQEDYQIAILNTHAFGYESIRNQQETKEFWASIAAVVVIVGVALVCPPAGIALGVVYGTAELTSAVTGKDWVSGRELGTGERWFRGVLAPLDIIPGAVAVKRFSGVARTTHMGSNLGELGFKTTIKTNAETSIQQLNDLVATAAKQAPTRLKNANAVIKERVKEIPDQLAKQAIGAGRVMDETVTNTKTLLNELNLMRAPAYADGVSTQAINTHFFENKITNMVNRFEGVNIGGTGVEKSINKTNQHLDDIVRDGSHILRDGTLKPNVKYQAGEYEYFYETDNIGRLKEFNADNLKLTERESRLPHNPKTPGKEPGDHAGHLAGDRFGGSPDLDNLVSQSSSVNLSKYKKLENQWAKAIEEGKDVSVNVRVNYEGNSLRPSGFDIEYEIDGRMRFTSIEN